MWQRYVQLTDITASAKNGTISASEETVESGTDYQVNFQPNEHYELSQLIVDGEQVESDPKQTEYTFHAVSGNHSVQAIFTEIPQYKIKTKVIDGKIDETASVYRDEDWTVSYKPKKHYELRASGLTEQASILKMRKTVIRLPIFRANMIFV